MLAGIFKYCVMVVAAIVGIALYFVVDWSGLNKSDWAAWVQAVGSIGAILGAMWVASEQHRRDVARRREEQGRVDYLVAAELAWVSHDIVVFLNQFIDVKLGSRYGFVINDDDLSDFLERLSWCRRRVAHKGQLKIIGQLRDALMQTVRVVRMRQHHGPMMFELSEIKKFKECRQRAVEASNEASGIPNPPQFSV